MKILALLTLTLAAQAQVILPGPGFDPALRRHLELTDDQVARIEANNRELQTKQLDQMRRIVTLDMEIRAELAKTAPDAMAVGSRYAEQESICRSRSTAAKDTLERNRAVLTATQRQRLVALQEAAQLASVVSEAQSANLYQLRSPVTIFDPLTGGGGVIAFPGSLTGAPLGGRSGCSFGNLFSFGRIVLP
jgi:hypothetical protein